MFDLGWSEMGVILMVALIVIGPKDLPRVAREIGKWTAKARSMARDFQRSLDDMAREAELQDIKAELDKATTGSLAKKIESFVDPEGELTKALDPNQPAPSAAPRPSVPPPEAPPAPELAHVAESPATATAVIDQKPDRG